MSKSPLCHLHGHSHFSNHLGPDALNTPETLVKRAVEIGMDSICLTDHGNVSGVPTFYQACSKAGLKAIVGTELYVCDESELALRGTKDAPIKSSWHLLALARNWDGLIELFALLTAANEPGQFYSRPRTTFQQLYDTKHLVFTSACMGGMLLRDDWQTQLAALHSHVGKDRLWLEIQAHDHEQQRLVNHRAVAAASDLGLGLVATQDFHYASHAGFKAHECLINIGSGKTIADPTRRSYNTDQLYITSAAEMVAAFYDNHIKPGHLTEDQVLSAIANTRVLADQLDFHWQPMATSLPTMAANPDATLMRLCLDGLKAKGLMDLGYLQRLDYEFKVLQQSGFLSYFLVMHDVVSWARAQGIMIGPGRGSAAGSLVSYALGITSVDPIRHKMMFERFYRPGRMDLPDIDTDFEDSRRGEVLNYIVNRFGHENVSKISTYGQLHAKGSIKDVGRLFGLDHNEVNRATVAITDNKMTPDQMFGQPSAKALFAAHPGIEEYARALTGVIRSVGEHASGIVVAGVPLHERGVVKRSKTDPGMKVINWDMRQAEQMGLMKLDILGLTTLQVVARANDNIQARTGMRIDFEALELDDPKVLALFNEGKTVGVFQFESSGIRKALKEVGVSNFEDVVVVNALYRPGPMDLIPVYADGKRNPGNCYYAHPSLQPHLEQTYGVMVYQEQTMSIAREVAGFSWEATDKLRKAVGKKLPAEMAKLEKDFVDGCVATSGLDVATATHVWSQVEKFAGYGFNRSHAFCYSVVAYWTAWLKVHYPTEFYAALLSATHDDAGKRSATDDAVKAGVQVVGPNVNVSSPNLYVPFGNVIRSPLTAIKGLGQVAAEMIVGARQGLVDSQGLGPGETRVQGGAKQLTVAYDAAGVRSGPFTDRADFMARTYSRVVNTKIVGLLEACGAMPNIAADAAKQAELLAATIQHTIDASRVIDPTMVGMISAKFDQIMAVVAPKVFAPYIRPQPGTRPRIMVILDKPEWQDRDKGQLGHGDGFDLIRKILLDEFRLTRPEIYLTSYYRFFKPPRGYEELEADSKKLLEIEIKLLQPPMAIACGTGVVKALTGNGAGKMHGQMVAMGTTPILCLMSPVSVIMDSNKLNEFRDAIVDNLNGHY